MAKIVRSLILLAVCGVCTIFGANSFAKEVIWDNQVIYAVDHGANEDRRLVDDGMLSRIGEAIGKRIERLKKTGQLPFEMGYVKSYPNPNAAGKADEVSKSYIAMVPVILSDESSYDVIQARGKDWYKYDVRTLISLMFCQVGEDGIHIVYNMPMYVCGLLGSDFDEQVNSPLPKGNLMEQFEYNACYLASQMTFSEDIAKYFEDKWTDRSTYQVVDVNISSRARENILKRFYVGAARGVSDVAFINDIRKVVVMSYTSEFVSKHPKLVLLPDKVSGNEWKKALAKHLYYRTDENSSDVMHTEEGNIGIKINLMNYSEAYGKSYEWDFDYNIMVDLGVAYDNGAKLKAGKPVKYVNKINVAKDIDTRYAMSPVVIFGEAARWLGEGK